MANEKRVPGFLIALYGSYTTQWALFVIMSIVISTVLNNNFESFKSLIGNMQFSASFMIPVS